MTVLRKAAFAAVLLAAAAPAVPASAFCFGSATTARACVNPENIEVDPAGGPTVDECVTVVAPPCVPVGATLPSAGTSGPLYDFECYACTDVPGVVATVTDALRPTLDRVNQIVENATKIECAPGHSPSSEQAYAPPEVMDNIRNFVASCT